VRLKRSRFLIKCDEVQKSLAVVTEPASFVFIRRAVILLLFEITPIQKDPSADQHAYNKFLVGYLCVCVIIKIKGEGQVGRNKIKISKGDNGCHDNKKYSHCRHPVFSASTSFFPLSKFHGSTLFGSLGS